MTLSFSFKLNSLPEKRQQGWWWSPNEKPRSLNQRHSPHTLNRVWGPVGGLLAWGSNRHEEQVAQGWVAEDWWALPFHDLRAICLGRDAVREDGGRWRSCAAMFLVFTSPSVRLLKQLWSLAAAASVNLADSSPALQFRLKQTFICFAARGEVEGLVPSPWRLHVTLHQFNLANQFME